MNGGSSRASLSGSRLTRLDSTCSIARVLYPVRSSPGPQDGNFHAVKAVLRTIQGNTEDLSVSYCLNSELQLRTSTAR
ncbi:glycoside hydrolase family 16 protein [Neolentinus lepideus HHB14362 ss-1]|uniref:Glycoside hydrolase family 16 protein n=1 Tax=Neolentinus lepideus HHB14362 ss-1 TaxID=1314782 RepID=A0A165VFZ4_9AGAM|nr:glycoside hydrolase family 16 protein [Neolentinus lepideus HHB14362 ss-1]